MDTRPFHCAAAMPAAAMASPAMHCCCIMFTGHTCHQRTSIGLVACHRLHVHPLAARRSRAERRQMLLADARLLDQMAVLATATMLPICWIYMHRLFSAPFRFCASNSSSTHPSQNRLLEKGRFASQESLLSKSEDEIQNSNNSDSAKEGSKSVILDPTKHSGLSTNTAVNNWNAIDSSKEFVNKDFSISLSPVVSSSNGHIAKVVDTHTKHSLTRSDEVFTPHSFDGTIANEEKEQLNAVLLCKHDMRDTSSPSEDSSTILKEGSNIVGNERSNELQKQTTHLSSSEASARKNWSKNELQYSDTQNGSVSAVFTNPEGSGNQSKYYSKDSEAELHERHGDFPTSKQKNLRRCISLYIKLLNRGRLQDCIDLLQQMKGTYILVTNRISHLKFFLACKRQKAVKEAFSFLKLVVKPSLRTYNLALSVCAAAGDVYGAFEILSSLKQAGLEADCMLYTTLISTCGKSGKVDLLFEVYHEMVNVGVEPNIYTYSALIDGCACAGEVAKAFGVYGIMRLKKIKPDRVVFNSLITACGRAGALERAFGVLSEMKAEPTPVHPDHVTIGALIKACNQAKKVDKALQVYKMMKVEGIRGSIEVYTEAVHACCQTPDFDTAVGIYNDLKKENLHPDEVFFSALIDVAGHAKQIDTAFKMLDEIREAGVTPGTIVYSSLMGACCKAESWQKALDLYTEMKKKDLLPSVSTFNALTTALSGAEKLQECLEVFHDMRHAGKSPNQITYTILLDVCERLDNIDFAYELHKQLTLDGVAPTIGICESISGLCLRKIQFFSSSSTTSPSIGHEVYEKWVIWALSVYRQAVKAGVVPTTRLFSKLFGCLRLPVSSYTHSSSALDHYDIDKNIPLLEGFGIYDPRALVLFEEAAKFDAVPSFSFSQMDGPIIVHSELMPVCVAEVYLLKLLKSLKHHHAAGGRVSPITLFLPIENKIITFPSEGQKMIAVASSMGQAIETLLRRLKLPFCGHGSSGKIRITGSAIRKWLCPREGFSVPLQYHDSGSLIASLSKGIIKQQQLIRSAEASQWSSDLNDLSFYQHDVQDQQLLFQSHSPSHKASGRKKRQDMFLSKKVGDKATRVAGRRLHS